MSEKAAFCDAIRDQLAHILHDWDHGTQENESPTEPCWQNYRVEADLLMPTIRAALAHAWRDGVGVSSRLPRNPYLDHGSSCACQWCYAAAMGGGR